MATRNLTADMITQLESQTTRPFLMYEGLFVGFALRLWTGIGDLSWASHTWLGNGWFQGFQGLEEDNDLGSTGVDIILAGVPQNLISAMLGSAQQGASGKLFLGFFDENEDIVDDPYMMFDGRLDVPTIDDKADGPMIQISYESALVELDRSKEYRYTRECQKIFNANDKGFDYVKWIATGWKGQWGATQKQIEKKKKREAEKKRGGGQSGGKNRK